MCLRDLRIFQSLRHGRDHGAGSGGKPMVAILVRHVLPHFEAGVPHERAPRAVPVLAVVIDRRSRGYLSGRPNQDHLVRAPGHGDHPAQEHACPLCTLPPNAYAVS
eukprot:6055594-Amphidinium_carterae.1